MIKIFKFSLLITITTFYLGCSYTNAIKDRLLPESDYKETIVKADYAMSEGNWAKAAMLYELAAEMKPENLQALLMEAQAYRKLGSQSNAIKAYQKIVDSNAESNELNDTARKEAVNYLSSVLPNKALDLSVKNNIGVDQADLNYLESDNKKTVIDKLDDESTSTVTKDEPGLKKLNNSKSLDSNSSTTQTNAKQSDIEKVIYHWLNAWQTKTLETYFSHYSRDYHGEMATHEEWKKSRTTKIQGANGLDIKLKNINIKLISEKQAEVSFHQTFSSNQYQDQGQKLLKLILLDDKWLISDEIFIKNK